MKDAADDTERDAWLREALRHAPDAQAAPPAALSDAILRHARAATNRERTPASQRPVGAWAAAWQWLARPPVAAGFASVMIATLLGLMWWDQPIDPTLARPPAPGATPAPPTAQAPAPPAPVSTSPPATAPAADMAAERMAKGEPDMSSERPVAAARTAPKAAPRRAEPEPAPFDDGKAAADAAPAAPANSENAATARAPASSAQAALRARGASSPSVAAEAGTAARAESRAVASGQFDRRAAAPAMQRRDDADTSRPAAFGALLASIAAEPERWHWQRGGEMQPMRPALQRWLGRIDVAAAPHWRSGADAAPAGETAVLRLYRDGALAATLRLDDATFSVASSQAALPRAMTAALKQALDEATR